MAMSSSQGCHFTLVESLTPRHCLLQDAVNENFLRDLPPLHLGLMRRGQLLGDCPTHHSVEWSLLRI